MAPPLWATDQQKEAFARIGLIWTRLLVEVVYNPANTNTVCKREAANEYEIFKRFAEDWNGPIIFGTADETQFNGIVARANGLAADCLGTGKAGKPNPAGGGLPGGEFQPFTHKDRVKGVDLEDENPLVAAIDQLAPGGAPPRDGSLIKTSSAVLLTGAGLLLIGAGAWLSRSLGGVRRRR